MRIKTVLLDADGVVQTASPGWRESVAALCPEPGSREEFLADVFAAERPTVTGNGSFQPVLAEVLARWGSSTTVEEALRIWQLIEPQTSVLEQAQKLRGRGLRVCLATNQHPERAAFMSASLGYQKMFDALFYSCELGHAKPDGAYFRAVLRRLQQPGGEVLFVDDHPGNVEAAHAEGLHARTYDLQTGEQGMVELLAEFGLVDE